MRFDGVIKSWNDERGFGFIEPGQGGQEIFVHVTAFRSRRGRPQVGQSISFEIEPGPQGKKRARNVQALHVARPRPSAGRESPVQWGTATLFAIPAFFAVLLLVSVLWKVPALVAGLYAGASAVTFIAYALDKSAAGRGAWRTPEISLHLLALVGGWPGALVAQQVLRHKSAKARFRAVFWGTVAANVALFVVLSSPLGLSLWLAR